MTEPLHAPTAHTRDRVRRALPERVDVLVIGAGLGGLMTAARCLLAGRSVAVIDAHYVAGGCATMFQRGSGDERYAFDIGLHYVGDCGPGGRLPRMLEEVGVQVDWAPLDPDGFDELVFPDLRFRIPASLELYRDRLVSHFPSEKAGIDRYIRLCREVALLGRADGPKGLKLAWEALTAGRLAAAHRGSTLAAFLDTCTQDPRLRAVIAGQNGDYGLPPSQVSAMLHCGLANHYFTGAWYPRGGGQVIADRLAARVEALGGTVHLRHAAEAICITNGRASGARVRGPHGESFVVSADVVVSNADIKRTFLELLPADAAPTGLRERAGAWQMGGAIFLTCLAVRGPLRELGMGATNYWQFDDYDFERLYAEGRAGEPPPVRGCYITSATLKDPGTPGHAPAGVDTVEIMALMPGNAESWGVSEADARGPGYRRSAVYQRHKARVENELVARLEALFPGSTREVLHRESATPVTHTRYTWASGGSGYGLAATPAQFLSGRPGTISGVDGLFLCGASTRTGHGIIGALASGVVAARAIQRSRG